jgi:hypothetical protein
MASIGNGSLCPSALEACRRQRRFHEKQKHSSQIPWYFLKGKGAYVSLMNMTTSLIHALYLVTFKCTNKCFDACLDHCSIACSCYCDKYSQPCLQRNHPPLTILSFHSLPISQTPNERTVYFSFFFGRSWLV